MKIFSKRFLENILRFCFKLFLFFLFLIKLEFLKHEKGNCTRLEISFRCKSRGFLKRIFYLFYLVSFFFSKLVYLTSILFVLNKISKKADGFARQQYLIWLKALSRATTKKILQLFYSTFLFRVKLGFVKTYLRKKEKRVLCVGVP